MIDLLFETSWEVCNRVGGIYAVLSTKAKTLLNETAGKVIFIGPDLWSAENPSPFFIEKKSPLDSWKASAQLPQGLGVRTGYWDVPGKPMAILVDYNALYRYKNQLYAEMWERYQVDSLHAYGDYDESCIFSLAAALVIEDIVRHEQPGKVVAHFDEWTTGMGLLHVKAHLPQVATVFTTHATSIGRSICGNGKPLYDYMQGYNGDQMAQELNMHSKHSLEKAAAQQADAFTTVSEVTAVECEQLLERRPFITPNAFEQNFVPKGKKFTQSREAARQRLLQVASALTGEQLGDDTLLMVTSGRCEFRNKGLDVVCDSLAVLRDKLNAAQSGSRGVVMFITVPAWTDKAREDLQKRLCGDAGSGSMFDPIITHTVHNPDSDVIYNRLCQLGLRNDACDKLKVIYVPSYLNGNDGIFNLSYYDLLVGFDLSVFPSYYEPWGYTPLESVAFGVPTVTTDLAGFGRWVLSDCGSDFGSTGVRVIHRTDSNYHDTVHAVAQQVLEVVNMPQKQLDAAKKSAKRIGKLASWSNFMTSYHTAYEQALKAASSRR